MITNNDHFIDEFEQRLCAYTGAPFAIVTDRCTNAIVLACHELVGKEKEILIPKHTYLSVPMTLINYGFNVRFTDLQWTGEYQLGHTPIYDCAVGFFEGMYQPGTVQCLSFQQKKRLAIGKGGAILTDDRLLAKRLRRLVHDGRSPWITTKQEMDQSLSSIIIGFHFNMSPDEAAKGILLLNQLSPDRIVGSWEDYPDISTLECFKDYQ